jgi:FixJ family two-component response regulator
MIDHMDTESLVVVVDDDEWICRALQRVLTTAGYRARTFTSARAYLAEQDAMEPACLILDIMIPDLDGLTTLRESRSTGAEIPAIFITGTADLDAGVKAMKTGAFDLLEKPLDETVLIAAIENALRFGREQRTRRERLAQMWRAAETMTAREAQVCALVSSGRLNKQIAALIGTTEKTVKVHRARAMTKLGARSVAELVRAVDGLLDPQSPTMIMTADHRRVRRPHVLEIMASALRDPIGASGVLRTHSESTRIHSTESSDSAGHLHA